MFRETFTAAHDWRASEGRDREGWISHVLRREAEGLILDGRSQLTTP